MAFIWLQVLKMQKIGTESKCQKKELMQLSN